MMERMSLISSLFRSRKNLSKEVKQIKEKKHRETPRGFQEEEGPCTSYFQREEDMNHEEHLESEILSEYLAEYKAKPRAFKETLALPYFIQLEEGKRPYSYGTMRGNIFLLSTFDASLTCAAEDWLMKLEAFFLLHPIVYR